MKVDIVEHPEIDYYLAIMQGHSFPGEIREKITNRIIQAYANITAKNYYEVPPEALQEQMTRGWAKALREDLEGFNIQPVNYEESTQTVTLTAALMALDPKTFYGRRHGQSGVEDKNRSVRSQMVSEIKKDVRALEGVPEETKAQIITIIESHR